MFPKIWNLTPSSSPPLPPIQLGRKEYVVLNIFARMIFNWWEVLLLDFWIDKIFVKVSSDNYNNMKPVRVAEVKATKFSRSLFLLKFTKVWCLFKKFMVMNPKNHWVNNFCFNFCFLFLLYIKLATKLKPAFFLGVFLLLIKFLHERRSRRHFQ